MHPDFVSQAMLVQWAEDLVFSTRAEAKLEAPPEELLTWLAGVAVHPPDAKGTPLGSGPARHLTPPLRPGRTSALCGLKVHGPLPTPALLEQSAEKARLLHSFANHELLAIEIMAWVLLRFPDAPWSFQRGIVQTICDEQKHLALYRGRIQDFGHDFGDFGVNFFLWDICRLITSPLEFVTLMGMTFEQANLDFAKYYQKLFSSLEDKKTAAILATVYYDETKHVHHGLHWFNEWRPNQKSDWDEYQQILRSPMSPARAKGLDYDPLIRRKIGFSEQFVSELSIYQHSKGRPPDVWWFNPAAEAELENGRPSFHPNQTAQMLFADLGSLLIFLAKQDDVVIVEKTPSSEFLLGLKQLGFTLPQLVSQPSLLKDRKLGEFRPWAVTPRALAQAESWQLALKLPPYQPDTHRLVCRKSWAKTIYQTYQKELNSDLKADHVGTVCYDLDEVHRQQSRLLTAYDRVVFKADFNCSGRGNKRLGRDQHWTTPEQNWLEKHLQTSPFGKIPGAITVEPWLAKVADFSTQILISEPNDPKESADHRPLSRDCVRVLGITRFFTDSQGHYLGHFIGDQTPGLSPKFWRWYHENAVNQQLTHAAQFVGKALFAAGYRGYAGIDSLVFEKNPQGNLNEDQKTYEVYSVVEINTRLTMGSVALALKRKVPKNVAALWLHLSPKHLSQIGFTSFGEFITHLTSRAPLTTTPTPKEGRAHSSPMILSGALPTNDPSQARNHLSLLVVHDAVKALQSLARPWNMPDIF